MEGDSSVWVKGVVQGEVGVGGRGKQERRIDHIVGMDP